MVTFSALLLIVILYMKNGIMGGIEFSWKGLFRFIRKIFPNKKSSEGSAM
jgi:branched-chain amino acid transport system permease protein